MLAAVKTKVGYDNLELLDVEEPQVYGDMWFGCSYFQRRI